MSGLKRSPAYLGLLSDLAFFHELKNILSELIGYYLIACDHELNLKNFEQLALQFCYDTDPDGFDALYELSEKYRPDSDKGKIVREILRRKEAEPDSIDFLEKPKVAPMTDRIEKNRGRVLIFHSMLRV